MFTTESIDVYLASFLAVGLLMLVTWVISLIVRDASIVDIAWGLGFVAVAYAAWQQGPGSDTRGKLLLAMVGVWGVRLAAYLAWRNLGNGEDYRYEVMRRRAGVNFWFISFVKVYLLQAVLVWVVSLPIQLSAASYKSHRTALEFVGIGLYAVGMFFETVGDFQLARFKARPDSEGKVMDRGLWRYTRHPNYFGDCCVMWGIYIVAAGTEYGRWGFIGPIVMTVLLVRVSGVALLEKTIGERRPGYDDYVRRTSAFFPLPPKRGARTD